METNVTFETYLILNDEEFQVEVSASGEIVNDKMTHEFGIKTYKTIDNVYINNIYNVENDETIMYNNLNKVQQKTLLNLASDYLEENEIDLEE